MSPEENTYQSPEARTEALMGQNVADFAKALQNRRIAIQGSGKSVVITGVQPFTAEENKGRYKPLLEMQPGTLWVTQMMGNALPLVAALDNGKPGGCVRLMTALTHDDSIGRDGKAANGKQIMDFFGVEKGAEIKLTFKDDSETLFLGKEAEIPQTEGQISSDHADKLLNDVFGEQA